MTIKISIISSFLIVFCFTISYAQKIKNENVTVQYSQLPTNPMADDFSTYSVSLDDPDQVARNVGMTGSAIINNYFDLNSFQQLPKGGHFHIVASISRLKVVSSQIKEKTIERKNKDGSVTKSKRYWKEFIYYMPIAIKVEDYNGNVLFDAIENASDKPKTFLFKDGSSEFVSRVALRNAWNKDGVQNRIKKTAIESGFKTLSKAFQDYADVQQVDKLSWVKIPKGKKVANADEFLKYGTQALEALAEMRANEPITNIVEDLAPSMSFWKEQAASFNPKEKKQAKMFHACNYNLAIVSYWMDDLAEAKKYTEECKKVNTDASMTRGLDRMIKQTEQLFIANNTSSSHFAIDISGASSPEGANYEHLATQEKPTLEEVVEGYVITTKGDSIAGEFVISDGDLDRLRFYDNGNVSFVYTENGEIIKQKIRLSWMERASFNGRQFFKIPFKRALGLQERPCLMEILVDGPKVQLYKFHETFLAPREAVHITNAIRIQGGKLIDLHITNPRFTNWKSAFAKLFNECEVLSSAITIGEYKRNKDDIERAIEAYNKNECEE